MFSFSPNFRASSGGAASIADINSATSRLTLATVALPSWISEATHVMAVSSCTTIFTIGKMVVIDMLHNNEIITAQPMAPRIDHL